MNKTEGWAVTFNKFILVKAPAIPDTRIKTFHGDNWLWLWTRKRIRKEWYKDLGNPIWHMIGQSTLKLGKRKHKMKEKNEYRKILEELDW